MLYTEILEHEVHNRLAKLDLFVVNVIWPLLVASSDALISEPMAQS